MPGTLQVGGHNIITHSGTSGAGTVNLVDQAGNAILTDSGSGMAFGNATIASTNTFPNGSIIQTAAKQMRNSSSDYWTNTISSNTNADPDQLGGLKCTFARDFTSGSTIVWQLLVSPGNGANNTYGVDIRLKPYYRNSVNGWSTIDSVVWPTDGLNLLSCCLPSSSIGSTKEVGFGVSYSSGSGTLSIARIYSFCMVIGYEIKFDTDPLA